MFRTFIKQEKYKLLATALIAGFFIFFWVNGPLLQTLEIIDLESEETEFSRPKMVGENGDRAHDYGTVEDGETKGFGHWVMLEKEKGKEDFGVIQDKGHEASMTEEAAKKVLAHARELLGKEAKLELRTTPEMYYVYAEESGKALYMESKGIVHGIRGYAGPVHIGLFVNDDGTIRSVHHISSKETESYLQKIHSAGFYAQFEGLKLGHKHKVDAVSGATLTTEALARTTTALVDLSEDQPLSEFAAIDGMEVFLVDASLSNWWMVHIAVIFLLFLYGFQKKLKKSKRGIIILSILSVAYIGFFLNNSFTYVSFIHPFVGTTVSSLVGLYAMFTLLGAIWGKNTYCKYVCPFGNVQRLIVQLSPKKYSTKFFIPNKWVKRIRGGITVVLITGVLLGLRNWSNFELFPDLFGLELLSVWFGIAVLTVLMTVRYPMIWCRLLCPTGSVLDFISDTVSGKKKKAGLSIKRKYQGAKVIFALLVFIAPELNAQTISVLSEEDKNPIPFAHVIIKPASGKDKEQVFLTDTSGKVNLEEQNIRQYIVLSISYIGHEKLNDTTYLTSDKTYYLKPTQQTLNQVVVTGQYAPNSPEKAVHKIKIIDKKKIESMAAVNLRDVLTNEMNIRISQDNILGSSISLQGVSGENVKILIDGVPVIGRQNGSIDLSQINLDNIERIEIIEGPMSVCYGTNALAGTINLITKKKQKNTFDVGITSFYESIGNYNLTGRVGYQKGKSNVSISGGRNYFDGWEEGEKMSFNFDPQLADSSRFLSWKPKEQYFGEAQYLCRFRKLTLNYKGAYFKEEITNRGLPRAPFGETAFDDYYRTWRIDNALYLNGEIAPEKNINVLVAYNNYERVKNTYYKDLTTLKQQLTENPSDQDSSKFTLFNSRGTYSTSKKSAKLNYELGYDVNLETAFGKRIENQEQKIGDYAVFASAEYQPIDAITLRPGLRYAYNTAYASPLIPSLNIKATPKSDRKGSMSTIRFSYARGFRAPSLKELYFFFVDINHNIVGNGDLKAEYSHNLSLAYSYTKLKGNKIYKGEVSGFYNDIRNMITLAQTIGTEYSYANIGRYKTLGANVNAELAIEHLKLSVGGSYIGRYNHLSENEDVEAFSYTPELRGNVLYELKKWNMTTAFFYKFTGRLPNFILTTEGEISQNFINAYQTADLTVSKFFWKKRINLALGSKNLFNVRNVSAGATGGVHSSNIGSVPVAMGRTYFLKLEFKIGVK